MSKRIEVRITKTGEVEIATEGYKGAECLKATEQLEKALGSKVSDKMTEEYKQQYRAPLTAENRK